MGEPQKQEQIDNWVDTDSLHLAALARYLGHRITEVESQRGQKSIFSLNISNQDWSEVKEIFADPQSTLQNIAEFCKCIGICTNLIRLARMSSTGIYVESEKYRLSQHRP